MAEPTGLNTATSSKYITFFERSMVTSLDNFRWGTGLHYENFGLLDGSNLFFVGQIGVLGTINLGRRLSGMGFQRTRYFRKVWGTLTFCGRPVVNRGGARVF